jgi:hypothetical protein
MRAALWLALLTASAPALAFDLNSPMIEAPTAREVFPG